MAQDELQATFKEANWDEKTVLESDGIKITRTRYDAAYSGDLEGNAVVEALMIYRHDGTVSYAGAERFEGSVRGKRGSFVVQSNGEYADGVATTRGQIVSGAGTGELAQLKGAITQRSTQSGPQTLTLRVD
jgi:hypothetical protein